VTRTACSRAGVGVLQRFQGALYVAEVAVFPANGAMNLVHLALREQGISLDDVALDVEARRAGGWWGQPEPGTELLRLRLGRWTCGCGRLRSLGGCRLPRHGA